MTSEVTSEQNANSFDAYVRDRVMNNYSEQSVKQERTDCEMRFAEKLCKRLVAIGVLTEADYCLYFG